MYPNIVVTKSDGTKETFEEAKLVSSLKRAGASPASISDVTSEISKELQDGMSTTDIYSRAFELLKKRHKKTAVKYSLRRAMFELGPDGFPFEKFVARIFQLWGYEILTDQTVMGVCVPHEMDVIAWKNDRLDMVEAKFHNEVGLRSDLKVVLYVKARFDDLSLNNYNYGGLERKLSHDGRWLFTNTKFTDLAIKYAECNKIRLVSWNYPNKDNLHDIIESNNLYPITCLSALSSQDKKNLIGLNVLTCLDIIGNPSILNKVGIHSEDQEKIIEEAQSAIVFVNK